MDPITVIVSSAVAVTAAAFDLKTGKIPNVLTFTAMLFGVIYAFCKYGAGTGLERCILLVALFLLGMLSIMGMGDLKLLMALGALNGLECLLITVGIASILLLTVEVIRRREETWRDIKAGFHSIMTFRFNKDVGSSRKVKFAPYLLCGLVGGIVVCSVL